MHTILNTYCHLLADVSHITEVPLAPPSDLSLDWVIKDAPLLDKQLLMFLEHGVNPPVFPSWLMPLWEKFLCYELLLSELDAETKTSSESWGNKSKYPANQAMATNVGIILRNLRQLLLFGYKSEIPHTNEQLSSSQEEFVSTDEAIDIWDAYFSVADTHTFKSARALIGRVIGKLAWQEIIPAHGPGSVFPSRLPSEKGRFLSIYPTIDRHYPYCDYFCGLPSQWPDTEERQKEITVLGEIESRLVAVPKDSRGPRLISVHPSEAIWIQQGQRRLLEKAIERSPLTSGRIKFDDQSVNGNLALSSSADREYCTLDLKEASDRISCKLVKFLFGDYAYEIMACSRASRVKLLDGRVHVLRKFAPMGNAITFPLESLVFWAMVRSGIRARHGVDCGEVFVFGDDVLFPSKYYDGALYGLIIAGSIPNEKKTFRKGFFRESCGVDAYRGKDVTPHRLKKWRASSVVDLISLCMLAKNMRADGYECVAAYLYKLVRERVGVLHLSNNPNAQGIYEYVDRDFGYMLKNEPSTKYNRKLHLWQSRITTVRQQCQILESHAWWHVQESLLKLASRGETEAGLPSNHKGGSTYALPRRVQTVRGWTEVIMK